MRKYLKSIHGREFMVTPNHGHRTFTIRIDGKKYRTNVMSEWYFNECLKYDGNDWEYFMINDKHGYAEVRNNNQKLEG